MPITSCVRIHLNDISQFTDLCIFSDSQISISSTDLSLDPKFEMSIIGILPLTWPDIISYFPSSKQAFPWVFFISVNASPICLAAQPKHPPFVLDPLHPHTSLSPPCRQQT